MVDITITAASVIAGADAVKETRLAAATVTAGQLVYLAAATDQYGLADSNSATAEVRVVRGIALHGAASGQPLTIQKSGSITIGATLTAGVAYYASDTPGGICPVADVGSGEYVTLIGLATSTTVLAVDIQTSSVAL